MRASFSSSFGIDFECFLSRSWTSSTSTAELDLLRVRVSPAGFDLNFGTYFSISWSEEFQETRCWRTTCLWKSESETKLFNYIINMRCFIPKIRRLGNMSPQGLILALDLVLYVGRHSYGLDSILNNLKHSSGSSNWLFRIADRWIDVLFSELLEVTAKDNPAKLRSCSSLLKEERDFLAEYKVEKYVPKVFWASRQNAT